MNTGKKECRSNTVKEDAIKLQKCPEGKTEYNPQFMCQICGYTSHSAKDCYQRITKQMSTPFGHTQKQKKQKKKDRRRKLKLQQRPRQQLEYTAETNTEGHSDD